MTLLKIIHFFISVLFSFKFDFVKPYDCTE